MNIIFERHHPYKKFIVVVPCIMAPQKYFNYKEAFRSFKNVLNCFGFATLYAKLQDGTIVILEEVKMTSVSLPKQKKKEKKQFIPGFTPIPGIINKLGRMI